MASITQTIPDYLRGVSKEPDHIKGPGFLRECKNAVPDITFGLMKRPGTKFEFALPKADETIYSNTELADGLWFALAQGGIGDSPFIGVLLPANDTRSNTEIKVWNLTTKTEATVTNSDHAYLQLNDRNSIPNTFRDFRINTIDQITVIVNTKAQVTASGNVVNGPKGSVQVSSVANLPAVGVSDTVYHVLNTGVAEDDYFTEYVDGAYVETAEVGSSSGLNPATMPVVIKKTGDNSFSIEPLELIDRAVGSITQNPHPSFINSYINNSFFYLNRIGFLSEDNIILSQPIVFDESNRADSPINFYRKSALVLIASDPVDVSTGSIRAVQLQNVQPAQQGLLLFGDTEQFLLYSDSAVISPRTTVVKSLSTYNIYGPIQPVELGDEFYFVNRTPRHLRVFKLTLRGDGYEPIFTDISKVVSNYVPNTIDSMSASSHNQMLSFTAQEERDIFFYRRYVENGELQMTAWYKWEMPGMVQFNVFIGDRFFLISFQDNEAILSSAYLNEVPIDQILVNAPDPGGFLYPSLGVGPFLDMWARADSVAPTRTSTNQLGAVTAYDPIITLPDNYPTISGVTPCVVVSEDVLLTFTTESASTNAGAIFVPTDNGDGTWTIRGSFSIDDLDRFIIGYRFDYDLELPTIYYREQTGYDYSAYTLISRVKLAFGQSGIVQFKLKYLGRNDIEAEDSWENLQPNTAANYYRSDRTPIDSTRIIMFPIHNRNTSFDMRVFSDSPFPVTLNQLKWEGQYVPSRYKRT